MTEVFRHESKAGGGEAVYLTDGHINLACLPARGRPEGMYHFGFQVDDVEAAAMHALEQGATQSPRELPRDGACRLPIYIKDPTGRASIFRAAGKPKSRIAPRIVPPTWHQRRPRMGAWSPIYIAMHFGRSSSI